MEKIIILEKGDYFEVLHKTLKSIMPRNSIIFNCQNPTQSITILKENKPEIAFIDIQYLNSLKKTEIILKNFREQIPIILVERETNIQLEFQAINIGLTDFLRPGFISKKSLSSIIAISKLKFEHLKNNKIQNAWGNQVRKIQNKNKALQLKNEDLIRFVYNAGHDLKAPLASITGITNLALSEKHDPNTGIFLSLIQRNTTRLERIITDLLNISMLSSDKIDLMEISFSEIINETIESFSHAEFAETTKIRTELIQKNKFYSDKNLITSIVQNLIENAIKYGNKKDQKVKIKLIDKKDYVILKFIDNGQGIPIKLQLKVFEMFFRGNESSKGSGLGLYITKLGVEKLKGTITILSKEGKGSVFSLKLPNLNNQKT